MPRFTALFCQFLILLVCATSELQATQSVALAWDPNVEPDIVGYLILSGTHRGVYTQQIEIGTATAALVSNLVEGKTYFFAVTAYNTAGLEGAPSNEVSYKVPRSTPTVTLPSMGAAQVLSPVPGSNFTSSSVTFSWNAGSASAYQLYVGASPGALNIYDSGKLSVSSVTVDNLPTDGSTIYVRLRFLIKRKWRYSDQSYRAFSDNPTTAPTPTPSGPG